MTRRALRNGSGGPFAFQGLGGETVAQHIETAEERDWRALERVAVRLAGLDPSDRSEEAERARARLLALRGWYRARLGIDDAESDSRALTDRRIAQSDSCLARARRVCGLPAEGPVDWRAVREAVLRLDPATRSDVLDPAPDPDEAPAWWGAL